VDNVENLSTLFGDKYLSYEKVIHMKNLSEIGVLLIVVVMKRRG
jgi:hypothetical protein